MDTIFILWLVLGVWLICLSDYSFWKLAVAATCFFVAGFMAGEIVTAGKLASPESDILYEVSHKEKVEVLGGLKYTILGIPIDGNYAYTINCAEWGCNFPPEGVPFKFVEGPDGKKKITVFEKSSKEPVSPLG